LSLDKESVGKKMEQDKVWYVLKTRPRQEKAVRSLLEEYGVESYLPTRMEEHVYVNGRKKTIEMPLLPSTCFMLCAPEQRFAIVNSLKYKTDLLTDRFTNSSMVVPARQMEDFMKAVAMADMAMEQVDITEGDRVVVSEGEFSGMEGVVAKINGRRRFVISLSNLTAFALQIPLSYLKKIK
jgi:transcription antitermination factor NusG